MRKRLVFLVFVAAVLASPVLGADKPQNVILFGWDGAQRNHVKDCLAKGELPTLKKLAEEGALVEIDIIGTTDTKAGWSEILTGYGPKVTGVYSNGRYDTVPKGLSIFERFEAKYGKDDFVTVAVIGKKGHCGEINPPRKIRLDAEGKPARPAGKKGKGKAGAGAADKAKARQPARQPGAGRRTGGKIIEENGVKYRVTPASPYYNMHSALEVWEFGLTKDERVGTKALEYLDKYKDKPFLFFVHFAEVDHSGHRSGENSAEYNNALISNDTWTGKIIAKLKQLGLYEKTLVVVTADHGFDEGGKSHKYAPYVFLAANTKKVNRNGLRGDVTPTIYDLLGLDVSKFEPKLDGSPLTRPAPADTPKFVPREGKGGAKKGGAKKAGAKKGGRKKAKKGQPQTQ